MEGVRVVVQGAFEAQGRSLYPVGDLEIKASDGTGTYTRCQGTGRNSTVLGNSRSAPADGVRFFPAENLTMSFPNRVFNLNGRTSNRSTTTIQYVDNERDSFIKIDLQENLCAQEYEREFYAAKCRFQDGMFPSLRN